MEPIEKVETPEVVTGEETTETVETPIEEVEEK